MHRSAADRRPANASRRPRHRSSASASPPLFASATRAGLGVPAEGNHAPPTRNARARTQARRRRAPPAHHRQPRASSAAATEGRSRPWRRGATVPRRSPGAISSLCPYPQSNVVWLCAWPHPRAPGPMPSSTPTSTSPGVVVGGGWRAASSRAARAALRPLVARPSSPSAARSCLTVSPALGEDDMWGYALRGGVCGGSGR